MFQHRAKIALAETKANGVYTCSECGSTLFDAAAKFTVGSGFPSFWEHLGNNVKQQQLSTYNRDRIQLVCRQCGQHLGHLFPDDRTPTNLRYCINAAAINHKAL